MYKILIVEDDLGIAEGIKNSLASWDIESVIVKDFRKVTEAVSEENPHLVLLDISLPFMDGYHWCREIRKNSDVPIVFISSASDNMNIIMAMNMGADDFIAKPFDLNVLTAKVQATLRRTYDFGSSGTVIVLGEAVLNLSDNTFSYKDEKIELSKNEYQIMLTLMQNKGKVVSREKLMEALWNTDFFIDENTLTVNVGRLRKKLETAGLVDFIKTKFGVGYLVGE